MSTDGLEPVLVDQYGGLVTLIDRSDLPVGVSPDCQNVEFFPGGVRSRSGFAAYATAGSTVLDITDFKDSNNGPHCLVLMSSGAIQDAPGAVLTNIPYGDVAASTTGLQGVAQRLRCTSMFGNLYVAPYLIVDPDLPAPLGIDFALQAGTNVLQFDGAKLAAVGQAGPTTSFTVTRSAGGTMSAGRHDFVVAFETNTGYVTEPSGPVGDTFLLGEDADLAVIPVGPGFVTRRIVFATPANSTEFFTLPRFAIQDNTTTTLTGLTFTDSELMSGVSLEDYLSTAPIPNAIGVEKYGRRLVYWGMTGQLRSFFDADASTLAPVTVGLRALTFDGRDATLPSEWTPTGAGGSIVSEAGMILQGYRITGDGATAVRGQIDQVALNYGLSGTRYVWPNRLYGLRALAKVDTSIAGGDVKIEVRVSATNVPGSGTLIAELTLAALAGKTDHYRWWSVAPGLSGAAVDGQYVNIRVYGENTIANGKTYTIDHIELFELADANTGSVLSVTPPDDPETVNAATGLLTVAENDGQAISNVFQLRGNLYICKERSLYVTTDNGDDPVNWTVDQVSSVVGTPSPHGVGLGDGWAVIVSKNGCYHFSGGAPEKISQEIQPTWDGVNWSAAAGMWVVVDSFQQRVYIGVPTGVSLVVNKVFVLDYVEGFGDPISSGGSGRKWTVWPIAAFAGAMVEPGETRVPTFSIGVGTALGRQAAATYSDFTNAFTSYYETAPIGTEIGRSLFDRLIMRIRGSGSLTTQSRTPGGTLTTLTAKTLSASPDDDIEIKFHNIQTQLGFRIGTSGATDYWSLRRLGAFLKQAPFSYLRKT